MVTDAERGADRKEYRERHVERVTGWRVKWKQFAEIDAITSTAYYSVEEAIARVLQLVNDDAREITIEPIIHWVGRE